MDEQSLQRSTSDLARLTAAARNSSTGSWTGSEASPVQSPSYTHNAVPLSGLQMSVQTAPLKQSDSMDESSQFIYFTVGEGEGGGEVVGDDEGEMGEDGDSKGLTKRDIHTLNEQRRRDVIKQGYAELADLVPMCKPSSSGVKLSRAATLQKTIDYILFLQSQAGRQQGQLEKLEREVTALRIMKENYEQIARAHQSTPSHDSPEIPDDIKFLVFQGIADQLFNSFTSSISVTSFDTLSSCIISWLEEYCKPHTLRQLVVAHLQSVNAFGPSLQATPTLAPPTLTPPMSTSSQLTFP